MASTKPQTPQKPPNFGLKNNQKFNNTLGAKEVQKPASEASDAPPWKKPPEVPFKGGRNGPGAGIKTEQDGNTSTASVNKTTATPPTIVSVKPSDFRRSSQVNVPDIFKQDSVNSNFPENRKPNQITVPNAFKSGSKNGPALSETSSLDDNKKVTPFAKTGSSFSRPGAKPQSSTIETSSSGNTAPPTFVAAKITNNNKSDENGHTQFNQDPIKHKLPGFEPVKLKTTNFTVTSATTPATTSSPALALNEDKVIDVKSMLRPTKQPVTQPVEKTKPVALKPVFPPPTSTANRQTGSGVGVTNTSSASESNGSADSSTSGNDVQASETKFLGNKWKPVQEVKPQSNDAVVERKKDSKKFRKIKLDVSSSFSTPPQKPVLPGNIDLSAVRQQYNKLLQSLQDMVDAHNNNNSGEDGEIYDDAISMADVVTRQPTNKRQSDRISIIPDLSAEDEGMVYDDGCTPLPPPPVIARQPISVPEVEGELYVDAETERKIEEEDLDQVYEDEETLALNTEKLEEERKRQQKEEAESKKKEEKERKEKEIKDEKKRKKEEKERAKKEMQLRKKFSLTGAETSVGEGTIKQDFKTSLLGGQSLRRGQTITILRLDNNPQNKWLIKSDNYMGYIDSSIIEVDPSIIRQAMANQAMGSHILDSDDQPVYDDVPQDGQVNDMIDDEEIYEECP